MFSPDYNEYIFIFIIAEIIPGTKRMTGIPPASRRG
jgi:hypothetical protein